MCQKEDIILDRITQPERSGDMASAVILSGATPDLAKGHLIPYCNPQEDRNAPVLLCTGEGGWGTIGRGDLPGG